METYETIEYHDYTIKIIPDSDPMDPRKEFDNLGTLVCFHGRYDLGDKTDYRKENYSSWNELQTDIVKRENPVFIAPVYLYDHSGLRIKIGSFNGLLPQGHAEFDSGQIGFIFLSREKAKKEYGRLTPKIKKIIAQNLQGEIKTYDDYLSGNVWGFQVIDPQENDIDSSFGYYGFNHEKSGLMDQAREAIDYDLKTHGEQLKLAAYKKEGKA